MKIHLLFEKYYKVAELTIEEGLVPRPGDYLTVLIHFPDGEQKDLLFLIAKTQYHFLATSFSNPQKDQPREYCIEATAKTVTLHVHPASEDASAYVRAIVQSKIIETDPNSQARL